jgi:hypothetical protein
MFKGLKAQGSWLNSLQEVYMLKEHFCSKLEARGWKVLFGAGRDRG